MLSGLLGTQFWGSNLESLQKFDARRGELPGLLHEIIFHATHFRSFKSIHPINAAFSAGTLGVTGAGHIYILDMH